MASNKKAAQPAAVNKEPITAAPPPVTTDFFDKLGSKAPLVVLALVFIIGFIIFKDYLFFEKFYYFKDISSDSYNYSYPTLYNYADYMAKHGIPRWSFNCGMGQNIFPFVLRDPFDLILFALGKNSISGGLVYIEFIKILLSGVLFFYYLRLLKVTDFTAVVGSLLFAFCGFMTEGSGWYIFSYEALNLALLLLAFELLFTRGKWLLFPIAIFAMAISMPFNLFTYGLFLALYAILRHLQAGPFDAKALGMLFLKMIGLGALGMLAAGPFLLENIVQLLESPRVSGTNSFSKVLSSKPLFEVVDKFQLGTGIMRFFSNDMLGDGMEFKGWKNILEAPMFYCGLPCLLLLPQVFGLLTRRVRSVFIVFIAIWLLPFFFPYFRYAFWLFSGDYYRAYSFFVALMFIIYSVYALDLIIRRRHISIITLVITLAALILLLNYPFFDDPESVNTTIRGFALFMLLVYAGLLYGVAKAPNPTYIKYAFLGVLMLELIYTGGHTINQRDAITDTDLASKQGGYNDYTVDAVSFISKTDKSFFRIDKAYFSALSRFSSLNDGLAQGYYGTSSYNSFNQLHYISFLQLMGVANKDVEEESRWARGLSGKPLVESQNQVKYMLGKRMMVNPIWRIMCDSLTTIGDVKVFRNKFALPFGYTYSAYMKQSNFEALSPDQKSFTSLRACTVGDKNLPAVQGIKEFSSADTAAPFNFDVYRQYVTELARDTMTVTKFDDNLITGHITVSSDKLLYLSIPFDDGWHLKIDGQPREKLMLDGGMTGTLLKQGPHTIEMVYELRYFNKGLIMSLVGILGVVGLWVVGRRRKGDKSFFTV